MKALVFLAVCFPAFSQSNFAALHGVVQDPGNSPVQKANVTVIAVETGARRSALTNATGWYEVAELAPGAYRVEVTAAGFMESNSNVTLEVGQQLGLEVKWHGPAWRRHLSGSTPNVVPAFRPVAHVAQFTVDVLLVFGWA